MSALAQQVVGLPTSHQSYQQNGWSIVAIPAGTKGPIHEGWNTKEGCLPADASLPPDWGIGLCHAYSGTCAIDIDDWERAEAYFKKQGIDLAQLFSAPDAVAIDSGNPGHGKLIYAMPFGMVLRSKKIIIDGVTAFELRCGTANGLTVQDVLPPSRHPSGTTYRWAGLGDWRRLPVIPLPILDAWQQLLDKDSERAIPSSSNPSATPASWEEVKSALAAISPDCDRKTWIDIGMALHATGNAEAFITWNDWSAKSAKYVAKEMAGQWRSFKDNPQGITPATLFHHAQQSGWRRPPPDIKGLFGPVGATPKEVIGKLEVEYTPPVAHLADWPTVLAARAEEVSKDVGCDPVVPLMAGLAAVSAAADKRIRLKLTSTWTVPPLLWLMTVGEPADKKSPGSRPMFSPIRQLELEDRPKHEAAMHYWKGLESRYAAQMKAYREWMASPEAGMGNGVPPPVDTLPPEPQSTRLIVSDATSQKVVHMASGRPRGFLMLLDEMNHWLNRVNDKRGSDDRGCWIQGYESGHYVMDRVGSGSIFAENLAIAMYGNCQPDVFKTAMKAGATDGLIQRFIPVVLNGSCTSMWQHDKPDFLSFGPAYEAMIRQVYGLQEQTYECTAEAMEVFRGFCEWYLEGRKIDLVLRASPIYMTAMGKIEGTCARLALLLHLAQHPHDRLLSADTMRQTIKIMKTFMVPSLQYAFMEIVGLKDETTKWVVDYIIQIAGERPTVTLAEIRAAGRRQFEGRETWKLNEELRIVMDELAVAGYVSLFVDHPRSAIWTINPALATQFKDMRQGIIKAKQQTVERFREGARNKGFLNPKTADAIGHVKM